MRVKPRIPLEDMTFIDNLMFRVWRYNDFNALNYVITILYRYDRLRFSTDGPKQEISAYLETPHISFLYLNRN